LFPFAPRCAALPLPAPAPCRLRSPMPAPAPAPAAPSLRCAMFPGSFPAVPAPAPTPWPWRSPKFPRLFSAPAPAGPPAVPTSCPPRPWPTPSLLSNDLIVSWFGFPLFVEARRFLSLAAACWRLSCSDVVPTLLALVIAFLCSAFGCDFIPPFPPLQLVRLAFTFLAIELLT